MKKSIYVKISDIPFELILRHPRLEECYKDFLQAPTNDSTVIEVDDDMIETFSDTRKSAAEVFWQYKLIGDELVKHGKMIFHGCAFLWEDSAFIFTAPSGTGKTTQFLLWKKLFGDEVSILNGDKPALDFRDDGIFVCPTPWNGKEGLSEMKSARLKGIILLRQAEENRIEYLEPGKAVQDIYEQVLFSASDSETILAAAKLTEKLLCSVKLWQMDNKGDEASAVLCHDTLKGEL